MKAVTNTLKRIALDGIYFAVAVVLTIVGFWSMMQIEASAFSMIMFGVLMIPSLLSTSLYLTRDIKGNHTFTA